MLEFLKYNFGFYISTDDFKHLKKFNEIAGDKLISGILLYAGNTYLPWSDKLAAYPISSLWTK